jgi:hypothetical protein
MGGTGAFQYSINGGSSFQTSSSFSGLAAGTYAVVVKDANGCFGAQQNFTLTQPAALGLSPAALPGAVAGQLFTQTFTASGGTGTKTPTLNGTLPNWLSFNAQTDNLSGTPPQPGTVSFSITVTDQNNCTLTQSYSLTVVCPGVTLSPVSLPDASLNTAYPVPLSANPAGGNYSFVLTSGLLPAGLTLNSNGSFSGAPANSGTFNLRADRQLPSHQRHPGEFAGRHDWRGLQSNPQHNTQRCVQLQCHQRRVANRLDAECRDRRDHRASNSQWYIQFPDFSDGWHL